MADAGSPGPSSKPQLDIVGPSVSFGWLVAGCFMLKSGEAASLFVLFKQPIPKHLHSNMQGCHFTVE